MKFELFTDCTTSLSAEVAGLHLKWIDVDLNLAICAAVGLRNRSTLDVGDLVAYLELSQILQLRLIQASCLRA
jgi:hypothetical protein